MSQGRSLPKCSGDASMPDNEPGASTRVIEKLNLRKGRLQWTVIVASERESVCVCVSDSERKSMCEKKTQERERDRKVRKRENETSKNVTGRPNERERDCRAVK